MPTIFASGASTTGDTPLVNAQVRQSTPVISAAECLQSVHARSPFYDVQGKVKGLQEEASFGHPTYIINEVNLEASDCQKLFRAM